MTHKFEIIEEIEVTFPHFRKYEFFYYKVLNSQKCINVCYLPNEMKTLEEARIEYTNIVEKNTFRAGSYEITEDEFNETFLRAIQIINNHKN